MSSRPVEGAPPTKKRRWLRRLGLAALSASLVFGIGYSVLYVRAKAELDAQIERIAERGEPLRFSDLAPEEPTPAETAQRLSEALSDVKRPANEEFRKLLVVEPAPAPGNYPAFRQALADNREALERIAELARDLDYHHPYDWGTPAPQGLFLPHVDSLNPVSRLLVADVVQSLGTGRERRAARGIIRLIDVAQLLKNEPTLIGQLVRYRMVGRAVDLLEFTLSESRLTAEEFRALDERLAEVQATPRFKKTVVAERASVFTTMENIGSDEVAEVLSMIADIGSDGTIQPLFDDGRWKLRLWGSFLYRPWLMREQAFALRRMTEFADLAGRTGPETGRELKRWDKELGRQLKERPINSLVVPALSVWRQRSLTIRQRLVAARWGLRVDRFRTRAGDYPESLEEASDKKVPVGVFSGEPLMYEVDAAGFAIYDLDPETGKQAGGFAVGGEEPRNGDRDEASD